MNPIHKLDSSTKMDSHAALDRGTGGVLFFGSSGDVDSGQVTAILYTSEL